MSTINHLILIIEKIDAKKTNQILKHLVSCGATHFTLYSKDPGGTETETNAELTQQIKINFFDFGSARNNLSKAFKNILIEENDFEKLKINSNEFENKLLSYLNSAHGDIIVKVSPKEESLENNALLEANYAEIFFIKKDPENFEVSDLEKCLEEFKQRQRNFGK